MKYEKSVETEGKKVCDVKEEEGSVMVMGKAL
jgi:hypothetical protein